ncbi:MAG TPA: amino acid permease [Clostridia bacterium]|nr:amino acid permease [Clostridia bacterium]
MKKGFNRNHLTVMALGNIIGSGVFLGSSTVISIAGPAAVLSYLLGGVIMAMEVSFITEMSVVNPVPGAFRVHATEIFGPWIGFVNGWVFWFCGILGMASEVAAAAIFTRFWFPGIPMWMFCIVYSALMAAINLNDPRGLSRMEGILASVKIAALIFFILFGLFLTLRIIHVGSLRISNPLTSMHAFAPNGIRGILSSMILVMFSYTGTGIIGLSIADAENPEKDAPSAIRIIITSVLALFVLSALFTVLLTPWNRISSSASPFVIILQHLKIPYSDSILNFIVLSAALSGLNSSMYSSSRMLNSLSRDGQAPRIFLKTNHNGVPIYALGTGSAALFLTAVLSYLIPSTVFVILATASGFLAMFNWLTISVTYYFYRKKTLKERPWKLRYKAPGYPYAPWIEMALIVAILITAPLYPGQLTGLAGGILLFLGLMAIYRILKKRGFLK